MDSRKVLRPGLSGVAVVAVCCFTPALVLLLGALGLSAWLARLDFVLVPLLIAFSAVTLYAVVILRSARRKHQCRD